MKWKVLANTQQLSYAAADEIAKLLAAKPQCVLGLATGSTPVATYEELIHRYAAGELDFSQAVSYNLDEYYGLPADHPQSYAAYMHEHLFRHVNMPGAHIHIPDGQPEDVAAYCQQYDEAIEASGGIDLQLLGIGVNGHIGFNEPADELMPGTHLVKLSADTIQANARFFADADEVPQYAITMGIGTIMKAKRIVLLATGRAKAEIVQKLFASGVTTDIPASVLHMHPDVTVLVDREAGSLLPALQGGRAL